MDFNLFHIFLHASLFQKAIILLLFSASLVTWAFSLYQIKSIIQYQRDYTSFHRVFWSGEPISTIESKASDYQHPFHIPQSAFLACRKAKNDQSFAAMQSYALGQANELMATLHTSAQLLSTIASNAPYVGLLGTVIGIMHTMSAMGQQALNNIEVIAPGIGEALFTTALGLIVAIPAAIFYNILIQHIQRYTDSTHYFISALDQTVQREYNN